MARIPPSGAAPKTVLHSGASFRNKFATGDAIDPLQSAEPQPLSPARRSLAEIEARLAAFDAGRLAIEAIDNEDLQGMIQNASRENMQRYANYAKRIFGAEPEARLVMREIVDAALSNPRGGAAATAPPLAPRLLKALRGPRAYLALRARQGEAFHHETGFRIGASRNGRVTLLDDRNTPAFSAAPETAAELAGEARYRLGLDVIRAAEPGVDGDVLIEAAGAAIDRAVGGKAIGDSLIFANAATRKELAARAIRILQSDGVSEAHRLAARQSLATAFFAEAMPHKQSLQILMDMAPLIGQARSAEAAVRSGKAAIAAFEKGDVGAGARHALLTAVDILGAAGGVAVPVAGAGSKAVRATIRRTRHLGNERLAEFVNARTQGKANAARARAEAMARRGASPQLGELEQAVLEQAYADLEPQLAEKIKGVATSAIGDAGELFFEPILQRWSKGALSEAQYKRMRAKDLTNGIKKESETLKKHRKALTLTRVGNTIHPDALVPGHKRVGEKASLKIVDASDDSKVGLDIKTGKEIDKNQQDRYMKNSRPSPIPFIEPPNINSHLYIHVIGNEWRHTISEALKYRFATSLKDSSLNPVEIDRLRMRTMQALDTVALSDWAKMFGAEHAIAGELRRRRSHPSEDPS